jgi:hypothetical protein
MGWVTERELVRRHLEGRDLPPCTPCPKGTNDAPDDANQDDLTAELDSADASRTYPADLVPRLCTRRGIDCM